jgi:hypothetical protein
MEFNPYTAPTAGSEQGRASGLRLSDELRAHIVGVAKLMVVAAFVQIVPATGGLLEALISGSSIGPAELLRAAMLGIVPLFVMIGAFTLLGLRRNPSDDLPMLLASMRQLTVAYAIKGVVLLLFIGLGLASLVFGFGAAALF